MRRTKVVVRQLRCLIFKCRHDEKRVTMLQLQRHDHFLAIFIGRYANKLTKIGKVQYLF